MANASNITVEVKLDKALEMVMIIYDLPTGAYVQKLKDGWAVRWRGQGHGAPWHTTKASSLRTCLEQASKEIAK